MILGGGCQKEALCQAGELFLSHFTVRPQAQTCMARSAAEGHSWSGTFHKLLKPAPPPQACPSTTPQTRQPLVQSPSLPLAGRLSRRTYASLLWEFARRLGGNQTLTKDPESRDMNRILCKQVPQGGRRSGETGLAWERGCRKGRGISRERKGEEVCVS